MTHKKSKKRFLNAKVIFLFLIVFLIVFVFAVIIFATGWSATKPHHSTLYINKVFPKSGTKVSINDNTIFSSTVYFDDEKKTGIALGQSSDYLTIWNLKTNPVIVVFRDENIGINTINPRAKLDVYGGGIIVKKSSASSEVCNAEKKGTIIYDVGLESHIICTQNGWKKIG